MICGMYRQPIGSFIKEIEESTRELNKEVNALTELLAKTEPEKYSKFLRYTYMNYQVVDTPDEIITEINNFDFSKIGHFNKEDLSGKCVIFIFLVDMFTDEFCLPLEFANNFNYARNWVQQKITRKERLSNLEKEFK